MYMHMFHFGTLSIFSCYKENLFTSWGNYSYFKPKITWPQYLYHLVYHRLYKGWEWPSPPKKNKKKNTSGWILSKQNLTCLMTIYHPEYKYHRFIKYQIWPQLQSALMAAYISKLQARLVAIDIGKEELDKLWLFWTHLRRQFLNTFDNLCKSFLLMTSFASHLGFQSFWLFSPFLYHLVKYLLLNWSFSYF